MTTKTGIAQFFNLEETEIGPPLATIASEDVAWSTKGRIEARGLTADAFVADVNKQSNSFLATVRLAYNKHYPLTLSPDHIWLVIAQGFAHHVNENAETLRDKFVDHDGKEQIEIDVPPGKGDPFYPWVEAANTTTMKESVLDTFINEIKARVKGDVVDTIMPTFSTTTIHSHAAMAVTTMSTFKAFFSYGMRTMCGIPEVRLLGKVEDWRNLRARAEALTAYETSFWMDHLLPVLDKIVESVEGNPDKKFWKQIIQMGGGSGGPFITGWINTLFPYMKSFSGRPRARNRYLDWKSANFWGGNNGNDFETSNASVPVCWNYNGVKCQMEFEAGIIGASQDLGTMALCPEIGWAVADVTNVAE